MEGMFAPRGTAPPTFDDCVQWYVEATRTSDKQWVADYAVAAWGQAYALAVAKVALEQTVAASGAGAGAGPGADTNHAREQARANAGADNAQRRAADRADGRGSWTPPGGSGGGNNSGAVAGAVPGTGASWATTAAQGASALQVRGDEAAQTPPQTFLHAEGQHSHLWLWGGMVRAVPEGSTP